MTVYFIGAGPGAADLLTIRGQKIIARASVIVYAGSLIPQEMLDHAACEAEIHDSAPLNLQEIMAIIISAAKQGKIVARLHSGDPSVYGAIGEQIDILRRENIDYQIIPGVTATSAAAAALGQELTLPHIAQSIVLTRTATRASAMPAGETLENFARTGATLAIHLSITNLAKTVRELTPHYGADCPVVVAYRVSWADEQYLTATLATIRAQVKAAGITRTALILVGPVLGKIDAAPSRLYDAGHHHILRRKKSS